MRERVLFSWSEFLCFLIGTWSIDAYVDSKILKLFVWHQYMVYYYCFCFTGGRCFHSFQWRIVAGRRSTDVSRHIAKFNFFWFHSNNWFHLLLFLIDNWHLKILYCWLKKNILETKIMTHFFKTPASSSRLNN